MAKFSNNASYMKANGLLLLLGVWLLVSPWILGASIPGVFSWNFLAVSAAMIALALAALYQGQAAEWEEWASLVLGVWLFLSPWILGYSAATSLAWNAYIVGLLAGGISIWGILAARGDTGLHDPYTGW